MLQRLALLLFLLLLMGASAMLAASHFGVTLPWDVVVNRPAEPTRDAASNNREPERQAATGADTKQAPHREEPANDILASTAEALGAKVQAPPPGSVALDISRVSPEGVSVFAGRAAPDSYVTVMEDGKPAASAQADANGEWSITTEHKFASTDPKLSFQTSATPPPPEEKPPVKTATAEPPAPAPGKPTPEASAAANDVMKKFESLVSEAREEARKEQEEKERSRQQAETGSKPAAEPSPGPGPAPDTTTAIEPSRTSPAETRPETGSAAETPVTPSTPAEKPTPETKTAVAAVTTSPGPKAEQAVIPVPLMFVYNEATLTTEGRHAANLLLEYLTLKHLKAVKLTGHADERGTEGYNFDLSRERLDTVARLLREGGYTGTLDLVPKGKSEPYMGIDRSKFHGEALYQFDRRVELHLQ